MQDDMPTEYSRGAAPRADHRRATSPAGDSEAVRGFRGAMMGERNLQMVYSLLEKHASYIYSNTLLVPRANTSPNLV